MKITQPNEYKFTPDEIINMLKAMILSQHKLDLREVIAEYLSDITEDIFKKKSANQAFSFLIDRQIEE